MPLMNVLGLPYYLGTWVLSLVRVIEPLILRSRESDADLSTDRPPTKRKSMEDSQRKQQIDPALKRINSLRAYVLSSSSVKSHFEKGEMGTTQPQHP